jgi:lycopene beta-cyclase
MSTSKASYAIIGGGASGLHLAMAMIENKAFEFDQLIIFEKKQNHINDKTWSFWEKANGKWEDVCIKSWDTALFKAKGKTTTLQLTPYAYKSISSKSFYVYCEEKLGKDQRIRIIKEEVIELQENLDHVLIATTNQTFKIKHVFDSRLPKLEDLKQSNSKLIWQHFKGWFIETEEDFFDDSSFTMMDYSLKDGNNTTFTYVLPFSRRKALVEFTYFTPSIVSEETYDYFIKKYIKEQLQLSEYAITDTEMGIIPMSNYPFEKQHSQRITKIGTSGGWVKASSGYSFKNAERKAALVIKNLVQNNAPTKGLHLQKFQHYDSLFLEVLQHKNYFGEELFYRLYNRIPIQMLFRFLDEETSFAEDLRLITSLTSGEFIQAFFKHASNKFNVHQ